LCVFLPSSGNDIIAYPFASTIPKLPLSRLLHVLAGVAHPSRDPPTRIDSHRDIQHHPTALSIHQNVRAATEGQPRTTNTPLIQIIQNDPEMGNGKARQRCTCSLHPAAQRHGMQHMRSCRTFISLPRITCTGKLRPATMVCRETTVICAWRGGPPGPGW